MSNQIFKMILTGPISAMGDVVNCATGHGGKIEMVEVEEAPQVIDAPVLTSNVTSADAVKYSHRLKCIDVYRALLNGDITDKSARGLARYLTAIKGSEVPASSVGTHLWKLKKHGVVDIVGGHKTKHPIYGVRNSGISPEAAVRKVLDAERTWQPKASA